MNKFLNISVLHLITRFKHNILLIWKSWTITLPTCYSSRKPPTSKMPASLLQRLPVWSTRALLTSKTRHWFKSNSGRWLDRADKSSCSSARTWRNFKISSLSFRSYSPRTCPQAGCFPRWTTRIPAPLTRRILQTPAAITRSSRTGCFISSPSSTQTERREARSCFLPKSLKKSCSERGSDRPKSTETEVLCGPSKVWLEARSSAKLLSYLPRWSWLPRAQLSTKEQNAFLS